MKGSGTKELLRRQESITEGKRKRKRERERERERKRERERERERECNIERK